MSRKKKDAKTRFAEAVGELGLTKAVELLEFLAIVQQQPTDQTGKVPKPGRATGKAAIQDELERRKAVAASGQLTKA